MKRRRCGADKSAVRFAASEDKAEHLVRGKSQGQERTLLLVVNDRHRQVEAVTGQCNTLQAEAAADDAPFAHAGQVEVLRQWPALGQRRGWRRSRLRRWRLCGLGPKSRGRRVRRPP